MKTKITYSKSTSTFRFMPYNYWAASVKNGKLVFNSWDGMTKKMFKSNPFLKVLILFIFLKLKITNKI